MTRAVRADGSLLAAQQQAMAPEAARGTITVADLQALAGRYRDRRRYVRTAADRGQTRRQAHHVIGASLDLAEEIARSGGRETPAVQFARSEVLHVSAPPPAAPPPAAPPWTA